MLNLYVPYNFSAKALGKMMKHLKRIGKVGQFAGPIMSFASMGFSIASAIQTGKAQTELNRMKEE